MIRIAIVDDELESLSQLVSFTKRYMEETRIDCEVITFSDGNQIVEPYQLKWDIIFMDINMKRMDGISASKIIRDFDDNVILIFITTMAKLAIKGYEVSAMDFVVKPITYIHFYRKLDKAVRLANDRNQSKSLLLSRDDRKEKVPLEKIYYVDVKAHILSFITKEYVYNMRASMNHLEMELKPFHFGRVSNSTLVNLKYVTAVETDHVVVGETRLILSRTKKKSFLEAYSKYISGGY